MVQPGSIRLLPCVFCAWILLLASGPVSEADEAVRLGKGASLTLDGRLEEPLWQSAIRVPMAEVDVPTPTGPGKASVDLRLTTADGRLCVGVTVGEDPGTAMGLHVFVAKADATTAAEAVSLEFRPVELRAPRLTARGPRGVGRTIYRVEGGADWSRRGAWSAELALPIQDLLGEAAGQGAQAPLRIAVSVYTRTPNVVTTWPAGARWADPSKWAQVVPDEGSWSAGAVVDAQRLAKEDAQDARRSVAWLDFLRGTALPIAPTAPVAEVEAELEARVFAPLSRVLASRPDLLVPVQCIRADVLLRLGRFEAAGNTFLAALAAAPGWREAAYGQHVQVMGRGLLTRGAGGSDYARWEAWVGKLLEDTPPPGPFYVDGHALVGAMLDYFAGRFAQAQTVLERLSKRYPHDAYIRNHAGFSAKGRRLAGAEKRRRAADEKKKLPRATVVTSKGTFVLELFQDDAPNTVNNFVYLARKKFYDGLAFHRVVPFFLAQTGDGLSGSQDEAERARIGTGTPGYAIRSEPNDRALLRGVVAMANAGRDTEGSQFFLSTGSAIHLQGEETVFGRVLQGQDVVERLTEEDRLESITFTQLDPARTYHPTDASGRPAPEPVAR